VGRAGAMDQKAFRQANLIVNQTSSSHRSFKWWIAITSFKQLLLL
jgi:hypothetical protein